MQFQDLKIKEPENIDQISESLEKEMAQLKSQFGVFKDINDEDPQSTDLIDPRLMIELAEFSNLDRPRKFHSHRKLLGPMIVAAKQFILKVSRPIIKVVLHDQIMINQILLNLANTITILNARNLELEKRIVQLEKTKTN